MKIINLKSMCRMLPVLGIPFVLAGCIDSSFDLSEGHLDKTVKLEAEGIALKFGSTEKVLLQDLIKVENNIVTDADNTYYIVERGTTDINFSVAPAQTSISQFSLYPDEHILDGEDCAGQSIAKGQTLLFSNVSLTGGINTHIRNISTDVKSILSVDYGEQHFFFTLQMDQSAGAGFAIKSVKNFKIKLPKDVVSSNADSKNEVHFKDISLSPANSVFLGSVDFLGLNFSNKGERGYINAGDIDLSQDLIELEADIELYATRDFTIHADDYVSLELDGKLNGKEVEKLEAKSITGYFDPAINPEIDPINIREKLPSVLTEGEQHFDVSGTTVRFDVDMTEEPADILARIDLVGSGEGHLPAAGKSATLEGGKMNVIYFYDEHGEVSDPDGIVAESRRYPSDINRVFVDIPDEVVVNLGDGRIHMADKPCTIAFGREYTAFVDYKFALPFRFNKSFRIEYHDTTEDLNGDLKDLQADGIRIVADVANTVPLDLKLAVVAKDIYGEPINVDVDKVLVKAAPVSQGLKETVTPIEIVIKFADPSELSRLDKVDFVVEADSRQEVEGGVLRSDMYLQMRDARIKFLGSIIADLNDE